MKIILTTNDGTFLDEATVTAEEWRAVVDAPLYAWTILNELKPGDEALKGDK